MSDKAVEQLEKRVEALEAATDRRPAIEPVIYRKDVRGREYVAVARDVGTVEALRVDGWRVA